MPGTRGTFARDRPSRYGNRENAPGIEQSRGTGPRATVSEQASLNRRAGACPPPCPGRGEIARDRPSRYGRRSGLPFTVGRGPVPRRARDAMNVREGQALALRLSGKCSGARAIARDRPSRYGMRSRLLLTVGRGPVPRRACGAMNVREGQALALRFLRELR